LDGFHVPLKILAPNPHVKMLTAGVSNGGRSGAFPPRAFQPPYR
jgi:hypothetical protein